MRELTLCLCQLIFYEGVTKSHLCTSSSAVDGFTGEVRISRWGRGSITALEPFKVGVTGQNWSIRARLQD